MADTPEIEDQLRAFRKHFESMRVELAGLAKIRDIAYRYGIDTDSRLDQLLAKSIDTQKNTA